ncbi:hypothetical protein [Paenibacillus sp. SN-8-1]|uniref:hypothetical protein n=1 Tax=Paenibacillus sp. SN-8-1 TaxID=3435409 RepID=UPI003D9A0FFC
MKKALLVILILLCGYLVYFYYFAEKAEITTKTVSEIALSTAYMEFGDKTYSIDSHVGLFKEKRHLIENNVPFYLENQRKYYYRVMVEYPNDPALVKTRGSNGMIIYTIDASNGNIISRVESEVGAKVKYYSH